MTLLLFCQNISLKVRNFKYDRKALPGISIY